MSAELASVRRPPAANNEHGGARTTPVGVGGDTDDATLAARAVTDRAAFGLLYDRYAERVFRYCYRRLGNREAAEDATSQVFLKALTSLPSYREGGTFVGWLFAIAFSTTVDLERRRRPAVPIDAAGPLADVAPGPEEAALATEQRDELYALIGDLLPDQRYAVELRLAGLSGVEVAAAMGRTHRAVKMLQFRAFQRLRRLLGTGQAHSGDVADDRNP